jgi:tRNA modification GTPase
MDLNGMSCLVSDTAGLRLGLDTTTDVIEIEGMKRAREAFKRAHIKVYVHDSSDAAPLNDARTLLKSIVSEDIQDEREIFNEEVEVSSQTIVVFNKIDLQTPDSTASLFADGVRTCQVSCLSGEGINTFEKLLTDSIASLLQTDKDSKEENVLITRERHRRHLTQCVEHLTMFVSASLPMDAAAEELRYTDVYVDCVV